MLILVGIGHREVPPPLPPPSVIARVAALQGIQIVTRYDGIPTWTPAGIIDGQAADRRDLSDYLPLLANELSAYPPGIMKKAGIDRVVLWGRVSNNGGAAGGISLLDTKTIYLDVHKINPSDRRWFEQAIHHEIFHFLDNAEDGTVLRDDEWQGLNDPSFRYTHSADTDSEARKGLRLAREFPGFLGDYSTTSVAEDKADLFAILVTDPEAVEPRAFDDIILADKVALLKARLARAWPEMGEPLWSRVRDSRRSGVRGSERQGQP